MSAGTVVSRVLVIEDDKLLRESIREILEDSGFVVYEAGDGRAGLRQFISDPADLVLTDIVMPEQEGVETIIALVRHDPEVKIIAMSGSALVGDADFLKYAKKFGAKASLTKPFRAELLVSTIREVLEGA